jgi:hypothetical protein
MKLPRSLDLDRKFCELVVLIPISFLLFLIMYFSILFFNIKLIDYLIFMGLLQSHDLGCEFCGLVKLTLICFVHVLIDLFLISSFIIG